MSILVLGSFVMDCVSSTQILPNEGETVIGSNYQTFFGGKGINQAVAAKRLGLDVMMVGSIGRDAFANDFLQLMHQEGINSQFVSRSNLPTGIGNIILDTTNAQNRIIVIPGANHDEIALDAIEKVMKDVEYVVSQLELKLEVVLELSRYCKKYNKPFILNPAPARNLPIELIRNISVLTPNEHELKALTGLPTTTVDEVKAAALKMIEQGIPIVVVTLGKKGALWVEKEKIYYDKGFHVTAIDTVAAGDAFNGALVYGLSKKMHPKDILKLSNATGALSVQKSGAIPSLPTMKDVENFLKEYHE